MIQRLDCCVLSWLCCTLQDRHSRDQLFLSPNNHCQFFFVDVSTSPFFFNGTKSGRDGCRENGRRDKAERCRGDSRLRNDTIYPVIIVDHNGTRTLDPGQSQDNYLVNGFSVDLTLKLSDTNEAKKNFPAKEFKDRMLKMSKIFADHIMDLHRTNALDAGSEFKLNPGSQEEEEEGEEEGTVSLSPSCPFEQKFKSKTRQLIVNVSIFYRSGPLTKKFGSFEITSITVVSSLSCRPGRAKNVWNLAVTSTKIKHTDLRILK